jgi:hypothetical protein
VKEGYSLAEVRILLDELNTTGLIREEAYNLLKPLWFKYRETGIKQDFVEDILDMVCGNYVGMNIDWKQ